MMEIRRVINTRVKIYKVLIQMPLLTLPPSPDSVTKAINRVNLQIKIWLQSLKQNLTLPSCEQNGWKWCKDNLIIVPVWFTRSQLSPTVGIKTKKQGRKEGCVFKLMTNKTLQN